jgi:hypothetical protein
MRNCLLFSCVLALGSFALTQQPAVQPSPAQPTPAQPPSMPSAFGEDVKPGDNSPEARLRKMWESKIEAEWEAIKKKDRKAYADLLADDYQGVEIDGKGERNKVHAVDELLESNIFSYSLWGFKMIPAGPDAVMLIYEVNMLFPPKSEVRFSRVYISELWLKRAGQWKEVHYQETHVK